MARARAVFLDRDGTLNEDSPDYIRSLEEFRILPGVPAALRRLHDAGFALVVVTNQSAIARGLTTAAEVERMHERLRSECARAGAPLLDVAVCPHAPGDGCRCRKPLAGMIEDACARHGIEPARSWMVGDKETDVEAGRRAGCRTVRIGPAGVGTAAEAVVADVEAAAEWIAGGEVVEEFRIPSREEEILEAADRALAAVRRAGFSGRGEPRLKLALIELLANAIEHGNRFDVERPVGVSIRRAGDRLRISISDEGPGFEPRLLERDLDAVDLSAKRGRGLGLVKKILGAPPSAGRGVVTIEFERGRFA